jgi:hypothetical protein
VVQNPSQEKNMSPLEMLKKINAMAEFNRWCGIEVTVAEPGVVEIQMPWRAEVGQYSGFLHAGLIGTLIDTACGFAADWAGLHYMIGAFLSGAALETRCAVFGVPPNLTLPGM